MIVTPLVPGDGKKEYSGVSSSTKAVPIRFATRSSRTLNSSDPRSRYSSDHGMVVSNLISILDFVASITISFTVVVVDTAVDDVVLATDVLATDVLATDVLVNDVLASVEVVDELGSGLVVDSGISVVD